MAKAKAELEVAGLAGQGLCRGMEELLSAIEGVEYVHVNLGAAKVTINYDDSLTGVEALTAAVKRAGYRVAQA